MLNYETILSSYDDKLTLMQWLKKVEAALQNASATSFEVVKRGNATLAFKITFADGTALESGDIVLQQGESVQSAAIVNGHLILTLTNGDQLDCGSLFNGNVDISGNVNIEGNLNCNGTIQGGKIVEIMNGYGFTRTEPDTGLSLSYVGIVKNGNKLTYVVAGTYKRTASSGSNLGIGYFTIPAEVGARLVNNSIGALDNKVLNMFDGTTSFKNMYARTSKSNNTTIAVTFYSTFNLANDLTYEFRYEATMLLNDNLI